MIPMKYAAVVLTLTLSGTAWAAELVTRADVDAVAPDIEAYVNQFMKEWATPGLAIGIVAEDELVYAQGFGVRQIGGDAPVTPETVFQIGSATKAFLGLTQAMLVDEGKLAWSDPVIEHYPSFKLADPWVTREFRIADLLAQRSGLPGYTSTDMMFYDYPKEDIIRSLEFITPVSSFRADFAYQNVFHLVAEKILAQLDDVPTWNHVLQARIFDPLGMTSSSYSAEAMNAISHHASSGHRYDDDTLVVDPLAPFPYNAGGAGNINSNIQDMSQWLRLQINQGRIDDKVLLSDQAFRTTHEPRVVLHGPMRDIMALNDQDIVSYATGWVNHATPEGRVIEHGGGTVGFTSHVGFDPDRQFGVVVLTNQSAHVGSGPALPLGKYVLNLLQKREKIDYAAQALADMHDAIDAVNKLFNPPEGAAPHRDLTHYTGTYTSPTLGDVTIAVQDGSLAFTVGPRSVPVSLTPWSGDVFVSEATLPSHGSSPYVEKRKLRFFSDSDNMITGFDWSDGVDSSGQPPFLRAED